MTRLEARLAQVRAVIEGALTAELPGGVVETWDRQPGRDLPLLVIDVDGAAEDFAADLDLPTVEVAVTVVVDAGESLSETDRRAARELAETLIHRVRDLVLDKRTLHALRTGRIEYDIVPSDTQNLRLATWLMVLQLKDPK